MRVILDPLTPRYIEDVSDFDDEPMLNDGFGGTTFFYGLKGTDLARLKRLLPRQHGYSHTGNSRVYFNQFVDFAKRFPEALFFGYVVDAQRDDERITIEGFTIPFAALDPRSLIDLAIFCLQAEELTAFAPDEDVVLRAYWH